ncbi:MAG: NADH-quinone oxidoreductase subunit N [Chloroflexi bacterium]|nr:NADH-quinone oxidoreductase subunit N [Chloroflexota bacterium]
MENLTANLYLLWPEFLLTGLAFVLLTVDFFLPPERKNSLALVAIVGLAAVAVFTVAFLRGQGEAEIYQGIILADRFSLFFKVAFLGLGILTVWSSADFVKRYLTHPGEYYAMVLFSILGMIVMASAGELLTAYIGLELLSFSLYILVSHARDNLKSNEAGTKYILLGAFASALLLYGISIVYGAVAQAGIQNPTTFAAIETYLRSSPLPATFLVGMALIIAGVGFKVAAVPFHMWTPDVYEGAPLPITAYLAVGSKAAAFALALRLFADAFMPAMDDWQMIMAILAAATMILGNLAAIAQRNIKRMLAYSSIGQVGYLLMGIAALSGAASNAMIFHLVGYGITNLGAFVAVIAFHNATGKEEIADFAGLGERNPFIAMALTVSLFSLAGLPIFAGFVTKFYLFAAAAQADLLWLVGVAVTASLISLYYYLMVIKTMYVDKSSETTPVPVTLATGGLLGLLTLGTVLIGVYPRPLVDAIQLATNAILP